ncbi:hypothetical protein HG440_000495 [Candidatus Saccharibacteria bacterium]|nr:hypothetical protein [Candidatus Saccharibacteria bacterium]
MIRSATTFSITHMPPLADLIKGQPLQAGGYVLQPIIYGKVDAVIYTREGVVHFERLRCVVSRGDITAAAAIEVTGWYNVTARRGEARFIPPLLVGETPAAA